MLRERQIADLALWQCVSGRLHSVNSAATSLFVLASAFRLGTARLQPSLSIWTPSLLLPQDNHVYDRHRPCKSDSIATNLTRIFFSAKNSCDQTSDLEVVKRARRTAPPLYPPTHNSVSQSHIILKFSSISTTSQQSMTEDFCSA
jgi:hypothetical protein